MNANAAILLIVIATFCFECDKISEQTLACLHDIHALEPKKSSERCLSCVQLFA